MKIKINNYTYKNPIVDNLTILNMSDTHGDIKHINLVLKYLENNKVDLILLPGDIYDRLNDKYNKEFLNKVKELTKYAKVYSVIGNHDVIVNNHTYIPLDKLDEYDDIKELKNIKDFYISTNPYNKIELDNIDIHFIVLPNTFYEKRERKNLCDELLNNIENNIVNNSKFNIMLVHSPNPIIKKKKIIDNKLLDQMNLIICGHNHGGLTPTWIQDKLNNHLGLVGPYTGLFNKQAYGIYKKNNTSLLISNGVTKISRNTLTKKLIGIVNKVLIPEIDIIKLKKDSTYNLELDNRKKIKE